MRNADGLTSAHTPALSGRVVVVGSVNVDLVVTVDRLPAPGETVLGGHFAQHHGGKGANQAVAAARAGARVRLIGAVGDDVHGTSALEVLEAEGVDVASVRRTAAPTGVALIAVGPRGENQIVVAPGANHLVAPSDIGSLSGEVLITNYEIPMDAVVAALRAAHDAGMMAILNPAPAYALAAEVLALSPILTLNERELVAATGNDDPVAALDELTRRTHAPVIVTKGRAGALLAEGSAREPFPGFLAPAEVDTTGAGDTFVGVLAAWLSDGSRLDEAIRAANAAAALSVAAAGAREGMPTRDAITRLRGPAEG
jgi:ribokinase